MADIRDFIFDVDGTLVDSVDLHAEAWRRAFADFGKTVSFGQIRSQIGKGGDQLLPVFWTEEELARIEKPLNEHRSGLFRVEFLPLVKPFPKVRELFQCLLGEGRRIALASSAKKDELHSYRKIAGIDDLVDEETSQDDAARSKPHPDILEAALEKLGHPRLEETVMIGDTPYDIDAARKAGLATLAMRCGGFPEESLAGAVAIYDSPADLLAAIERSPLGSASLLSGSST